ncbi:MAG: EstA family serine hydrolase, partial [Pseudomonadales bacterium]
MTEIVQGYCDERFLGVKSVMASMLASGEDLGSSFCATWKGETVVDLWGGHLDVAQTQPWQSDSIVNVYSTT